MSTWRRLLPLFRSSLSVSRSTTLLEARMIKRTLPNTGAKRLLKSLKGKKKSATRNTAQQNMTPHKRSPELARDGRNPFGVVQPGQAEDEVPHAEEHEHSGEIEDAEPHGHEVFGALHGERQVREHHGRDKGDKAHHQVDDLEEIEQKLPFKRVHPSVTILS